MQVVSIEMKKTAKGADYKSLTLADNRKLNVFQFHTMYESIQEGTELPNDIIKQNGKFWELEDTKKEARQSRGAAFKGEQIRQSQERKGESIKISSTFRDATLIVVAEVKECGADGMDFKERWLHWRKWLWEHYDDPEKKEWIEDNTQAF